MFWQIMSQLQVVRRLWLCRTLFRIPLIVLNEKRQIVFMNRAFMRFLELDRPSEILGYRLGEVLGCTQSLEDVERENLAADVESLTQCWQP